MRDYTSDDENDLALQDYDGPDAGEGVDMDRDVPEKTAVMLEGADEALLLGVAPATSLPNHPENKARP